MLTDSIYTFIVLRDTESTTSAGLGDPFVPAYGRIARPTNTGLVTRISQHLAADERALAVAEAEAYLVSVTPAASGASPPLVGTVYPQLLAALPGLATAANEVAVEAWLMKQLDATTNQDLSTRLESIGTLRASVADLLLALVLTNSRGFDRDRAAFELCGFETVERFIRHRLALADATPIDASWATPILRGRIVLPLVLPPRPAPGSAPPEKLMLKAPIRTAANGVPQPIRSYIGDLILLKQHLRKYRLGEIAHIENVLKTEQYERVHRSALRTEVRTLDERETETESERDLQTTDRDELRREIESMKSDELEVRASFETTVTADLTPYKIVATVGAEMGYRRSTQQREATSQLHASEIVNRAKERYVERVKSIREAITTTESEDTTKHGFDNRQGTDHVVGVYRWIEKRYDLHLINYGRRLFYEFMVPEPAAYWRRLLASPADIRLGPPPAFPQLPPTTSSKDSSPLVLGDFVLRAETKAGVQRFLLPARWTELVALAGEWGVALEDPPSPTVQAHLLLELPPADKDTWTADAHLFKDGNISYYESVAPRSVVSKEPLKIPAGYESRSGEVAIKAFPFASHTGTNVHVFEQGHACIELAGRVFGFFISNPPLPPAPDPTPIENDKRGFTYNLAKIFEGNQALTGDVPVGITSVLNGVMCSLRLACDRTEALEQTWGRRMYERFSDAFADRLAGYQQKVEQAHVEQRSTTFSRPAAANREIERRELKRGVLTLMTDQKLDTLGESVVSPDTGDVSPPVLNTTYLAGFASIVEFFERAFDWQNLAYTFAPYLFARRSEWNRTAAIEHDDVLHQKFLSAGAARIQVPVRRGYESHVAHWFARVGLFDLALGVPWLASQQSIAEDLAAEARDGFEVGVGRISMTKGNPKAKGTATPFGDPQDVDRELRIGDHLYVIKSVLSPTEIVLDRDAGEDQTAVSYERGGVVVGPSIPVELPSTLVAIDIPTLGLPEFPARYS